MLVDVAFEITLASPLAVRSRREGRVVGALDHMPGSTLRGALAWAWQREFGDSELFREIFLSGENQFPFLYPGGEASLPYPLTAVACKRHPKPRQRGGHGLDDTLFARAKVKTKHGSTDMADLMQCPECGEDRKPAKGYRADRQTSFAVPTRTYRMGVGIEENTGGAASGILFGLVALEPHVQSKPNGDAPSRQKQRLKGRQLLTPASDKEPARFGGVGRLQEEHLEVLQELCASQEESEHWENVPLFAGAARARGFGQFSMTITKHIPAVTVHDRVGKYNYQSKGCFALTLASDAILVDRFLRNTTDLTSALPEALRKETEILYQHSQPTLATGWNALTQLPKEDEVAVQAGAVLLCQSSADKADLAFMLHELEQQGIGIRREEGFGRVVVCDPFHLPQRSK